MSDQPDAEASDNTQHLQQTDIHASGGIRTGNSGKRAAADPQLRPRGDMWNISGVLKEKSVDPACILVRFNIPTEPDKVFKIYRDF
jgi:hypothetical protein